LFDLAVRLNLQIEEREFSVEEAKGSREAFISAATTLIMPVVLIDNAPIANGSPGSLSLSLRDAFFDVAEKIRA
jgi:D-alanine transaminase